MPDITHSIEDGGAEEILRNQMNGGEPEGDAYLDSNFIGDVTMQNDLTVAGTIRANLVVAPPLNTMQSEIDSLEEDVESLESRVEVLEAGGSGGGGGGGGLPPDWPDDADDRYLRKDTADTAQGKVTFQAGLESNGLAQFNAGANVTGNLDATGRVQGSTLIGTTTVRSNGTMQAAGDITSTSGNISAPQGNVSGQNVTATNNVTGAHIIGTQDITSQGDITAAGTISAPNAEFAQAVIDTLTSQEITTDYLTVLKSAHFFELVIDQLRAQKGALLITCGQCQAYAVEAVTNNSVIDGWYVYYRADGDEEPEEGEPRVESIHQSFVIGDQAICQRFGEAHVGTMSEVSTAYYWRLVTNVSQTPVTQFVVSHEDIDEDGHLYHWIYLSNQVGGYDGGSEPAKGDDIVQLGYRQGVGGQSLSDKDLKARQSAIIISAYSTPDQGQGGTPALVPPSLAFYNGIKTFELTPYRGTYIDATGSYFRGTFVTTGGTVIGDDIEVNVETWRILPTPNVITNDTESITVKLLHFDGATSSLLTTLPAGKRLWVNGSNSGITEGSAMTIGNISYQDYTLTLVDATDSNIVYDSCPINVFDISGGNGQNGDTAEFVYIKLLISGETPSLPSNGQPWGSTTQRGWSKTMPASQSGYYIWMASRSITYNASNVATYGNWSGPIRVTGEKGEDGNGIKNIFSRSATALNVAPIFPNDYPDNPSGGSATSTAATGSRVWFDDPISPSEDGDVYISQSVTSIGSGSSKVWRNWSVPALWSKYNATAAPGESWSLLALDEAFKVVISNVNNLNNYGEIIGAIKCSLHYGVAHVVGDSISYEPTSEYTLQITTDNDDGNKIFSANGSGTFAGIPYTALDYDNLLTAVKGDSNVPPNVNYYYWMANGYTSYLPTKLVVVLQKGSLVLDIREVNLVFEPSHIFAVTEAALNSVYQGLSGNASGSYTTGFSQIRQDWASIRLGVSNLERETKGEALPADSTTEQFCYYRASSPYAPQAPTGEVTRTSAVTGYWTKAVLSPTPTDQYVFYSRRVRATANDTWGAWQATRLYKKYGADAPYYNNAQIQIKADEILNTVSQTYTTPGYVQSVTSTIDQKADAISLKVDQQTKVSENYIRHASLANLEWIDQEWTRTYSSIFDNAVIGHCWRYADETAPTALESSSSTVSCKSAILSSYLSRAVGKSSGEVSATAILSATTTSGSTYSLSVWVKRSVYAGDAVIGLGASGNNVSVTISAAKSFGSDGTTEDATSAVSISSSGTPRRFTIKDDNWHRLVITFDANYTTTLVYLRAFGTSTGNFCDFLVTKPCLRAGNGTTTTSARTYVNGSTNLLYRSGVNPCLFSNSTNVAIWDVWASVPIGGSTITNDALTTYVVNRLWNTEYYTNAVQMSGSAYGVGYDEAAVKRKGAAMTMQQTIPATMAAQLYGQDLVLSAYIKRTQAWTATSNGTTISPVNFGVVIPSNATNVAGVGQSAYVESGLVRFGAIDSEWHRVYVKFRIASSSAFTIGFKINITTGVGDDWVVTRPMLEIGTEPSGWVDSTGDSVAGALKTTGIDIEVGKITLNADNVEVANDLTIGGNTRVGGFIFNEQNTITSLMVHECYNPLDYGRLDTLLLSSGTAPALYKTKNILFPECTSSIKLTDSISDRVNINLPFYHKLTARLGESAGVYDSWPREDTWETLTTQFGYGVSTDKPAADIPDITTYGLPEYMYGRFLLNQLYNARAICLKYLGSTVTIENRRTSEDYGLWVYGVKGIIYNSTAARAGWYEYTPWNRTTTLWTLLNYGNSSSAPRRKEVEAIVDRMAPIIKPQGVAPYQGSSQYTVARQSGAVVTTTVGSTTIMQPSTLTLQARNVIDYPASFRTQAQTLVDENGLVDSSSSYNLSGACLPFIVEYGHFARLRLVYEEGAFFWAIEAYGSI